jgi:hypothetical protein
MDTGFTTSPWVSMWLNPRRTIRQIVDTDPDRKVLLLAAIAGIGKVLDKASTKSTGDHLSLVAILLLAVIVGPLGGVISLYIGGALLRWTGSWIGGRAEARDIRAAIAWASVLAIWSMLLWVPELSLFGKEMFTTETPNIDASTALTILFWAFAAIEIILGVWMIMVFLKCLGEVQGFSAWKALGNCVLVGLVFLVPILGIVGVVMLFR